MLIPAADMVGMPDYAGPNGLVHGQKVSVCDGIKVLVDSYLEPYVSTSRPYRGTIIQLATKVEGIINQFAALYP